MIERIKNRHLRRLALIAVTPLIFVLAPFEAIAVRVPETIHDWYIAFRSQWNRS
jgi:hypothetical protein